jgi:hypothetical protein
MTLHQRMMKRVWKRYQYMLSIKNKQSVKPLVHKEASGSGNSHLEQQRCKKMRRHRFVSYLQLFLEFISCYKMCFLTCFVNCSYNIQIDASEEEEEEQEVVSDSFPGKKTKRNEFYDSISDIDVITWALLRVIVLFSNITFLVINILIFC